jgi:alanine dehydrogenase
VRIAVPSEIKNHEYRVALTPAGAHELVSRGHDVFVQAGAGVGSSIPDEDYLAAGAKVLATADDVWAEGELVLKVKEPIAPEYSKLRAGQTLFTYLHLAADRPLTDALIASGNTSIAYETVQTANGALPLLAPMSEVAGRPARVVVIGGGVAGVNAATIAAGMGSDVEILDTNVDRLRQIDAQFHGRVRTVTSNRYALEQAVLEADLVIGAVLVAGAKAPKLVSNDLVSRMKPGSVLVDISIDQGGCFEDSRPTTHDDPTYLVHNSVFYCVANMPGAVPNTSTYALTNVTLPYAVALADKGWEQALRADKALALGLNVQAGKLVNEPVAVAHGLPHTPLSEVVTS